MTNTETTLRALLDQTVTAVYVDMDDSMSTIDTPQGRAKLYGQIADIVENTLVPGDVIVHTELALRGADATLGREELMILAESGNALVLRYAVPYGEWVPNGH